jgi:hypothetical protein
MLQMGRVRESFGWALNDGCVADTGRAGKSAAGHKPTLITVCFGHSGKPNPTAHHVHFHRAEDGCRTGVVDTEPAEGTTFFASSQ